jgi:S1-C subfamily serine protease
MSIGLDRPRGAIVSDIWDGGAADQGGLQQGDVVLAVDGIDVNDEAAARFRFATRTIGQNALLTVLRDGDPIELEVEAQPAPGPTEAPSVDINGRTPVSGSQLVQLSPAFNEENGIDPFIDGVMIARVGRRTAADYFGFRPGDRILEINGEPVETITDVNAILKDYDGERRWTIGFERRGERYERDVTL